MDGLKKKTRRDWLYNGKAKIMQEAITILKQTGARGGEGFCYCFSYTNQTSSPSLIHQGPVVHMKDLFSSSSLSSLPSSSSSQPTDGRLCSQRFFFSPHKSNSIMEEVKEDASLVKTAQTEDGKAIALSFYEESQAIAMLSEDPYRDFKCSFAEMVEAHEIREWPRLEELLHCYLRLNDGEYHGIIVLAFVDLLMELMEEDEEIFFLS